MNALVVYGTRYGATAGTSAEIAKVLVEEGFQVKVVNAKEEKIRDISEYDLVLVGTGVAYGRWTDEIEDFVKRFGAELARKRWALFASTSRMMVEHQQKTKPNALEETRKVDIDDKVVKFNLHPMSIGFFSGVLNTNKMNFLARRLFSNSIKEMMGSDGFKETEPGVYDMREWNEIRAWAKEVASKAKA